MGEQVEVCHTEGTLRCQRMFTCMHKIPQIESTEDTAEPSGLQLPLHPMKRPSSGWVQSWDFWDIKQLDYTGQKVTIFRGKRLVLHSIRDRQSSFERSMSRTIRNDIWYLFVLEPRFQGKDIVWSSIESVLV